jgi:anthranilate synthase/aminodeoxychorismate synthase-like glutamine amidotransferase
VKVLMIDNYDSFTWNLVHLFEELGAEVAVYRNDAISADEAEALAPDRLVISPGPGRPEDAGVSVELVRRLGPSVPTLGVCLGHQAMVEAFGGRTIRGEPVHGKDADIEHDGSGVFAGLPNPLRGGRYHSLVADPELPSELGEIATFGDVVMGVRHRELPAHGVQFHPESVLTPDGRRLLSNFLAE